MNKLKYATQDIDMVNFNHYWLTHFYSRDSYETVDFWIIFERRITGRKFREWCKETGIDLENITEQDKELMRMKWE